MTKPKKTQKVIFWDLETSPALVWTFQTYKPRITQEFVERPWSILCACWKVQGESKVHSLSLTDYPKAYKNDHLDDYALCRDLREALSDVDVLVGHNGDKFDLKMFNARLMFHGLEPLSHYIQTIDTLKEFRKVARAPFANLDYLGTYFQVGNKVKTEKGLWKDAIALGGNIISRSRALGKMLRYCVGDVRLLERVYDKMMPYMKSHPNFATPHSCNCPKCNSHDVKKNGVRVTKSGVLRQEYKCNNCGSYFRGRYAEPGKSMSAL